MYSESDIDAAIQSGALTPQAAAALRESVARGRSAPAVDEESFRLITGFNDIFVSIASILLLVAVGWIGASVGGFDRIPADDAQAMHFFAARYLLGAAAVAATSWLLAEYFTRRRRMALPSILLLGTFVYSLAATAGGVGLLVTGPMSGERAVATIFAFAALVAAGGAYAHWRRFHVPITIAALTAAVVATLISVLFIIFPGAQQAWLWMLFFAGLAVFAFAMWWDMSDRTRTTRRSDVAFWLHLFAAPMIAHPVFNLLHVMSGQIGLATALLVLALYIVFGIVALAVDRRALLVSSLGYVLYALSSLFEQFGAVSLNIALTALLIGSALLMLSAFWHSIRRRVVLALPENIQARLPELDRPAYTAPRSA